MTKTTTTGASAPLPWFVYTTARGFVREVRAASILAAWIAANKRGHKPTIMRDEKGLAWMPSTDGTPVREPSEDSAERALELHRRAM